MTNNVYMSRLGDTTSDKPGTLRAPRNHRNCFGFVVKYMFSVENDTSEVITRGGHSHTIGLQAHYCTQGTATFFLDDGNEKQTIVLDNRNDFLVIGPDVWHTYTLSPGGFLIGLSSEHWDEKNYIHRKNAFDGSVLSPND